MATLLPLSFPSPCPPTFRGPVELTLFHSLGIYFIYRCPTSLNRIFSSVFLFLHPQRRSQNFTGFPVCLIPRAGLDLGSWSDVPPTWNLGLEERAWRSRCSQPCVFWWIWWNTADGPWAYRGLHAHTQHAPSSEAVSSLFGTLHCYILQIVPDAAASEPGSLALLDIPWTF